METSGGYAEVVNENSPREGQSTKSETIYPR